MTLDSSIEADTLLGNQVSRVFQSIVYLCIGALVSWQSALWLSRLSERLSWPLIDTRWHDCWDVEHCRVSAFGYIVIVAFIVGPSLIWSITGFNQTKVAMRKRITMVVFLVLSTALYYSAFYTSVWP